MPGSKLVKVIFKREIGEDIDDSLAEKISKKKKEIFKEIQNSKPIQCVRELLNETITIFVT